MWMLYNHEYCELFTICIGYRLEIVDMNEAIMRGRPSEALSRVGPHMRNVLHTHTHTDMCGRANFVTSTRTKCTCRLELKN